ncbi:RibD family protein [Nonomuraea sp. NPDC001831]|uniref:RibD family protein n=1 Tax=Nonomuraea sp. NPDC001831 TaxID=3364340 RepID=UPI0036A3884F
MSVDGYIDDATPEGLLLSNAADFDRVDQVRAESDAILIGAATMRKDNPRLGQLRGAQSPARDARTPRPPTQRHHHREWRPGLRSEVLTTGDGKVVYCPDSVVPKVRETLGSLTDVVGTGPTLDLSAMFDDLESRGVRRLMVEGGSTIPYTVSHSRAGRRDPPRDRAHFR